MRVLGDEYVKSEFRAHRNVENPIHIVGFLKEWQMYAQQVEGDSWYGEKLDTEKIDKMSAKMTMCRKCKRRWFRLTKPCAEGMNMSNCPSFQNGKARSDRDLVTTMVDAGVCPVCTPEKYDADNLRLVKSMSSGVQYGLGPERVDMGKDVKLYCCCTMM
ncbi:MAG: hypothetical protein Q9216_002604 [Gyalolechia sp. 2 TL-2023]